MDNLKNSTTLQKIVASPWPIIATWWVGGLLAVFVPYSKWNNGKDSFYNNYGRYNEYQQQQQAYEEANNYQNNYQNGNGNNYQNGNGNNYQNGGGNNNNNGMRTWDCAWYQFRCRQNRYQYMQAYGDNNNGDGVSVYTPSWYQFLGGKYGDMNSRDREEMGMDSSMDNSGALRFVYGWSVAIFLIMLGYGTYVFYTRKPMLGLNVMLIMVLQYALLMLVLLPQGVISTDDRDLEESIYGWYGQMSVLMVYFYFAQVLYCPIMMILTWMRTGLEYVMGVETLKSEDATSMNYHPPADKPLISVTNKV